MEYSGYSIFGFFIRIIDNTNLLRDHYLSTLLKDALLLNISSNSREGDICKNFYI